MNEFIKHIKFQYFNLNLISFACNCSNIHLLILMDEVNWLKRRWIADNIISVVTLKQKIVIKMFTTQFELFIFCSLLCFTQIFFINEQIFFIKITVIRHYFCQWSRKQTQNYSLYHNNHIWLEISLRIELVHNTILERKCVCV